MDKRHVLITGITGMDGSYLAEFLLEKDYKVFGLERRLSCKNRGNLLHIEKDIEFIPGDMGDQNSLLRALKCSEPCEVYNFAAQSFVSESFVVPETTANCTGLGVLRILEAIREYGKPVKFYQASTSEMFGKVKVKIAHEHTPFYPRSPYGVAKLYAHWITKNYRESYNMFNCLGIAFNHESERRGLEFVTRKITHGVAKLRLGMMGHLTLGNLNAKRDWGYAPEYVEAMWLMLQQNEPDDYILATGHAHSVKDFVRAAFKHLGVDDWKQYVKLDSDLCRPAEVDYLCGDAAKAKLLLGWQAKVSFEELVHRMVDNDLELLEAQG